MNLPFPPKWIAVGVLLTGLQLPVWSLTRTQLESPRTDALGDPLPEGALLRLGTIRYRDPAGVNHAALSPDGKILATASEAGITLFDLATGKPRYLRESGVPNGFDDTGSLLAFAPDGKELFSVTEWGGLCCWDVAIGKLVRQLGKVGQPMRRRGGGFPGVVPADRDSHWSKVWFPPAGKKLVVSAMSGSVLFLNPATGETLGQFPVPESLCAIDAAGKTLAAVDSKRSEVALYDDQGKELRRFAHAGRARLAALSADGKRLVTANDESEIRVWDAATGKEERTIAGPVSKEEKEFLTVLAVTPDGNTLLAGTKKGDVHRWDLATGKEEEPLRAHLYWVTGLFFPPGGRTLVSVSWDHLCHRWDLVTGKAEPCGEGYAWSIQVTRSPDGRTIALGSGSGRLELWDAATGKRNRVLRESGPAFSQVRFSPDGKLLAAGQADRSAVVWDVAKGQEAYKLAPAPQPEGRRGAWFRALAFSPDGRFLVTSVDPDGTRLWELSSGKELWQGPKHGVVAFAPDGRTLVSSGWDQPLQFCDAATGEVRSSSPEKMQFINHAAFSPDASLLATCHHDGNIYLREPATGLVLKTLKGHENVVWMISFSPSGQWLASSGDETVRIWEVATGAEVLCLKGHESRAYRAEFGPDSRTVLSSSLDLTALLWSVQPSAEPGRNATPDALWSDLAGEPARAYRAAWTMIADPQTSSAYLRGKIAPAKIVVEEKRVQKLLADLESESFDEREAASRALAAMGAAIEPLLSKARNESESAEVRKRVQSLLDALKREPTPDDFRVMRAIQVLEVANTAATRRVLQEWAGGTAGVPLTKEAQEALGRLEKLNANKRK
jgi:WD40 repeat protein